MRQHATGARRPVSAAIVERFIELSRPDQRRMGSVMRLETVEDRVALIRVYAFSPMPCAKSAPHWAGRPHRWASTASIRES
jgi:hypothetical protein